jgi:hypothetical protein
VSESPPPQLQLEYGRHAPPWRRRRPIIIAAVVLALATALWLCWPQIDRVYQTWLYHRELRAWYQLTQTWQEPPTKLKYTENPADAGPSGKFERSYGTTAAGPFTGYMAYGGGTVDRLPLFTSTGQPMLAREPRDVMMMLFVHSRTNTAGLTRVIGINHPHFEGSKLMVDVDQIGPNPKGDPALLRAGWAQLDMTGICGPNEIRIYAGQADAKDPSRFTIPFEARGRTGHIDGVFQPGETFSKDPAAAQIEALANADVHLSVHLDAIPATKPAP